MKNRHDIFTVILFIILILATIFSFVAWIYHFANFIDSDDGPIEWYDLEPSYTKPASPYRFGVLFLGPLACVFCCIAVHLRKDATESYNNLQQNSEKKRKEKAENTSSAKQKTATRKSKVVVAMVAVLCCIAIAVGGGTFFYNHHQSAESIRDSYVGKWISAEQYSDDTLVINDDGTASFYTGTKETNGTWGIGPDQVMSLTFTSIYSSKSHNVWLENGRLVYEEYSGKNLYFEKVTNNSTERQVDTTTVDDSPNNGNPGLHATEKIDLPLELNWGDQIESVLQKGKKHGGNVERLSDDSTFVEMSQINLLGFSANQACYLDDDLGLVEIIYDNFDSSKKNVDGYNELVDSLTDEYGKGVEENNEEKNELRTVWKDGTTTVICQFSTFLRVSFDYDRAYK